MLLIKYLNLLWLSWLAPVNPALEQARADFKKVNETFMQPVFSVKMTYNLYKQHGYTKPNEVKTGSYNKNGESSYSNIDGVESIRTRSITISVQKEEKILVVSKAVKKGSISDIVSGIDTLLYFCSDVKRTEPSPGFIKYEMSVSKKYDMEFEKMEMVIDKKNHMFSKIVFYYPEQEVPAETEADKTETIQPKMEIVYSHFSKALTVSPLVFSEQNYVKLVSPKKYEGVGKYSGYKIYNQKFK